jgi:hypothetical protein
MVSLQTVRDLRQLCDWLSGLSALCDAERVVGLVHADPGPQHYLHVTFQKLWYEADNGSSKMARFT